MPERSIDLLFVELSNLKRDVNDTLSARYRIFCDADFDVDIKEVKLHRMKLQSMSKTSDKLHGLINHYLSMAELRLATINAVRQLRSSSEVTISE